MPDQSFKPAPDRVLIADDEHLLAAGLASSLRTLGYEVIGPVDTGQAAMEAAKDQRPDIALIDIQLPGEDGKPAAEHLWEELKVPLVIVSAFSDQSHVEAAQRLGVFGYLLKPVSTEHLRVTLAVAWARAVSQGALAKRVDQLETSLANRKLVEQAKWILIEREHIKEAEAHLRLQREARNSRRTLADVAREIIERQERESATEG